MQINIEKRYAFLIIAVLISLAGIVLVIAYGTNNPSVMGHTIGEINWGDRIANLRVTNLDVSGSLTGSAFGNGLYGYCEDTGVQNGVCTSTTVKSPAYCEEPMFGAGDYCACEDGYTRVTLGITGARLDDFQQPLGTPDTLTITGYAYACYKG